METNENVSARMQSAGGGRQYTTVGSVWQQQSVPMQPPERRGRTLRSFMSQPYDENLSTFTDNVPSFPHVSSNQYFSEYYPHHHPNQQLHQQHYVAKYSPLQQNFDRAVSPRQLPPLQGPHDNQIESPDQQINTLEEYHYAKFANMSGQQKRVAPVIPVTPLRPIPGNKKGDSNKRDDIKNLNAAAAEGTEEDDVDDEHDDEDMNYALSHMPTKTLVNLASYKNPMQKAAQRILTKARQVPPTAGSQAYPQVAAPKPPPGFSGPFGPPGMGPPGMGSKNNLSDSEHSFSEQAYKPFGPSPAMSAARDSSPYPAILARGPGAPQPLTAGPPGQRQFRPAAIENPWLKNVDKPHEANPWEDFSPRYQSFPSAQAQQQRAMHGASQQSNAPHKQEGLPPVNRWGATTVPWGMNMGRPSKEKMSDTLTEAQARKFYPRGLPADFNYDTEPIADDWQARRLQEVGEVGKKPMNTVLLQQTPGWQAEHKAKLHRDFYGGNNMINKDLNTAIYEQNSRTMIRAIGSEMKESKKAEGRVDNRKLTVEQADDIPVHRHAEPLLSMVYQTLAERPGLPKTQPNPDHTQ
ncbi:hypothetical protein F4818DRAFT_437812 [Hypoxylon cercidicola]|nr:hypothetical protein F4818DRAFT_437812 [Hypoxylon cercidicola]